MTCPKCDQKERQYKNGKTKAGSQRYRCHSCGCSYTPEKKVQGYDQASRQKAIKMYVDGAGLRRTGRQVGIHHQTVANWAKEEAEQLPEAPMPADVKTAEFDEIFTFIGDKKPNLSHYTCRSGDTLPSRLESGMGTFTRTYTSYCRPRTQSQLVLQ